MGRKKVVGQCRLCHRNGELSFEHVPPRAAFNRGHALVQTIDDWLAEHDGESDQKRYGQRRGRLQQPGFGAYTLCGRCNNDTGAWYGSEYVKWARIFAPEVVRKNPAQKAGWIELPGAHPARFLKQAISCLASQCPAEFGDNKSELRAFVLDKRRVGLPPKYDFYLTLVIGNMRAAGDTAVATVTKRELELKRIQVLTEYAWTPFAVTMTVDSPYDTDLGRISHWASYAYDEEADLRQSVRMGEVHTPFAGDFRNLREKNRDFIRNRLEAAGLQAPR